MLLFFTGVSLVDIRRRTGIAREYTIPTKVETRNDSLRFRLLSRHSLILGSELYTMNGRMSCSTVMFREYPAR